MKVTSTNSYRLNGSFKPEAWVATQKNRQKIYKGKKVYLEDGQEFEIELHNPTKSVYLAKVLINGKHVSSRGIILQPGQRVFLERFIEENRKLVYETYDVEDTEESKEAIADNGMVSVQFFEEYNHISFGGTTITTWTTSNPYPITTTNPYTFTCDNTSSFDSSNFILNASMSGEPSLSFMSNTNSTSSYETRTASAGSLETGRVQQGEESEQTFENGYGTFNAWASHTSSYQILPINQLPVETTEIRNYCSECGTRIRKSSWKFCPNCGESLE
jgi:hypothetical protein